MKYTKAYETTAGLGYSKKAYLHKVEDGVYMVIGGVNLVPSDGYTIGEFIRDLDEHEIDESDFDVDESKMEILIKYFQKNIIETSGTDLRLFLLNHPDQSAVKTACLHFLGDLHQNVDGNEMLYAAAPEMYEALKQIETGCHPSTDGEAWQFVEIAKNIAEQALLKINNNEKFKTTSICFGSIVRKQFLLPRRLNQT